MQRLNSSLKSLSAIGVIAMLPACFMSDTPFIPEGDAVRLDEAAVILVCSDEDDCARTVPNRGNKGYLMIPPPDEPDEEPVAVRFTPLMDTAMGPVWLTEIRMVEDEETVYVVGVTRRAAEYDADGVKAFDVELPWCGDVSEEERDTWGIDKLDSYTCSLPAKAPVADYLRDAYKAYFDDPEWWNGD